MCACGIVEKYGSREVYEVTVIYTIVCTAIH